MRVLKEWSPSDGQCFSEKFARRLAHDLCNVLNDVLIGRRSVQGASAAIDFMGTIIKRLNQFDATYRDFRITFAEKLCEAITAHLAWIDADAPELKRLILPLIATVMCSKGAEAPLSHHVFVLGEFLWPSPAHDGESWLCAGRTQVLNKLVPEDCELVLLSGINRAVAFAARLRISEWSKKGRERHVDGLHSAVAELADLWTRLIESHRGTLRCVEEARRAFSALRSALIQLNWIVKSEGAAEPLEPTMARVNEIEELLASLSDPGFEVPDDEPDIVEGEDETEAGSR